MYKLFHFSRYHNNDLLILENIPENMFTHNSELVKCI